jgi:hypothetical protein
LEKFNKSEEDVMQIVWQLGEAYNKRFYRVKQKPIQLILGRLYFFCILMEELITKLKIIYPT